MCQLCLCLLILPLGNAPRRKPVDGGRAVGQDSGLMTARYTVRGRNLVGRSSCCVLLHWDVKDVASFKTRWHINSGQAGKKEIAAGCVDRFCVFRTPACIIFLLAPAFP